MKKITDCLWLKNLKKKFRIRGKKTRVWMIVAGYIIAIAFVLNCAIYPLCPSICPVDGEILIKLFLARLGIGGARDAVLHRYFQNKAIEQALKGAQSIGLLNRGNWIPICGWALDFAMFYNLCLRPFREIWSFCNVGETSEEFLLDAFVIVLTISAIRDFLLHYQEKKVQEKSSQPQTEQ